MSEPATEPLPLDQCAVRLVDPERVAAVRERMPGADAAERMARVFHVLGEPARVRIVTALLEAGELCVCDLAATVGMTEAQTSQHLRVLRAERTVRNRRDGRMVYYSLDDAHVRLLMDLALQHVTHGHHDDGASPAGRGAHAHDEGAPDGDR